MSSNKFLFPDPAFYLKLLYCFLILYYAYTNRRPEMPLEHFNRITQDLGVMGGKPCIRGMRMTVGRILYQIGAEVVFT